MNPFRFNKFAGISAVAVALSGAPVLAQEAIDGWDVDADGVLTREEFVAGFKARSPFGAWDVNADASLDETELTEGLWTQYDLDDTDTLEDGEVDAFEADWDEGGLWYDGEVVESWDIDGDGLILRNEFFDGIDGIDFIHAFDADDNDSVSEAEFATGIFNRYDKDGDGVIQEAELTDIGDDMGDEGFWDV